jgi:hypothetical protein
MNTEQRLIRIATRLRPKTRMTRKAIGEYLRSKGLHVEYEITECDNGLRVWTETTIIANGTKIYATESACVAANMALDLAGVDITSKQSG